MTMHKQTIIRIAAILALTAASTSTFAQSNEYRRGYQDGFAAGQRAASEEGGHRRDWRVHIEEAVYGTRDARCDARDAVRDRVERNNGAVHVDNALCGDPARGADKYLRIIYRCGDGEPQRAAAREHETIQLSCRR
jgi:aldehyde:ferredoxin oxidoreductase